VAWLSGYSARKELSVASIDYLTGFQKKIILHAHSGSDTEGADPVIHVPDCQADFDDIRFTSDDGETLLDYYIESLADEVATVWVEADFADGNTTIYLYWGNSSATAGSSIANTFPYGDAFASFNSGLYVASGAGSASVSDGVATLTGDKLLATKTKIGNNHAVRARIKTSLWNSTSGQQFMGFSYYSGLTDLTYTSRQMFAYTSSGGERALIQTANNFANYSAQQLDSGDWAADTWGIVEIRRAGDHTEVWINDTQQASLNTSNYDNSHDLAAFWYVSTGTIIIDWAFIRKLAEDEPTVTIEAEEYQKAASETLKISLSEALDLLKPFSVSDSILVSLDEFAQMSLLILINASDSILVSLLEEAGYAVAIDVSEELSLLLSESCVVDNPTTASDKSVRRLHGKVKISYTDPSLDEDSEITSSSGFARGSTEDSLFDGMIGAPVKYMMLDGSCPLDGTVSVGSDSIGWRGDDMSDETGAVNEWIEISFATPRTIHNLYLYGDNQWNNFPVAFSIYAYDEEDNEIEIDGVSPLVVDDNDEINWSYAPLTALSEVKKIKYEISKISQPLQPIMITELYSSYSEEYTDAEIISIRVLEEMEYSSGSIPLGNISSNECAIKLNNSSHKFDLGNPYSPVSSLMLKNRRVEVWFGIEVPFMGETAWTKRGVFWTQDWSVPEDQIYVEITALDRLELLRKTEYYSRTLHIDKSIGYLLEKVLDDADLVKDTDYWIHPDLYEIIIPYGFFKRTSHREAVRSLAVAAQAKAYCDGDGCIVVEPWDPGKVARVQFTRNKFKRKDNPLAFSEIVNFVEVYANPREIGEEEEIYTDSEVLRIEPGETATRTCVFEGDDPCTDVQEADFDQSAIIDLSDVIWINLSEETNLDISSADTRWMRRDDAIRVTLDEDVEKATGAFLVEPEGGTPPGAGVHINSQTNYNWGSEIEFHNTGNVPFEITSITIRGKPVRVKGRKLVTAQDSGSIRAYGKLSLSGPIDNEFIQSEELAQEIADDILAANKATRKDVTIEAFGYTDLELGDRIQAVSFQNTELKNYALTSQEFEYDRGVFRVKYKGRRI